MHWRPDKQEQQRNEFDQQPEPAEDWRAGDRQAKRRQEQADADTAAAGQLRAEANARAEAVEEIGARQHLPVVTLHTAPPTIAPPTAAHAPRAKLARKLQQEASDKRRAMVAAAKAQTEAEMAAAAAAAQLPELDRAVEALVARYTCGSVIDAAWAADKRLWDARRAKRA
jgi:hypothetical protein